MKRAWPGPACWILLLAVDLLPGPFLMSLAKPPLATLQTIAPSSGKQWKARISSLLRTRCHRAGCGSTCLKGRSVSVAAGSDRCGQRATSRHEQIERRPQRAPCLARGTQQRLPVHVRSSSNSGVPPPS